MPANKLEAWRNPTEAKDREQALPHIQRMINFFRKSGNEPLAARLEQEIDHTTVLIPPEGSTHPLTAVVLFGYSQIEVVGTSDINPDYIDFAFTSPKSQATGFISHTLTIRAEPRSLYFGMRNTGSENPELYLRSTLCAQAGIINHGNGNLKSGSQISDVRLSPNLQNPPIDSGNYGIKQATLVDFAPWLAEAIRQEGIVNSSPATAIIVEALATPS